MSREQIGAGLSGQSQSSTVAAIQMIEALEPFGNQATYLAAREDRHRSGNDRSWHDSGFQQWRWAPPPRQTYTAPVPLSLLLAVDGSASPLAELAPWWSQIAIAYEPHAPATGFSGTALKIGNRALNGWHGGELAGLCDAAGIEVYDEHLNAFADTRQTETRIKGPGLVGSFVPGYAQIKDLASSASQVHHQMRVGCRIAFRYVSAITLDLEFSTVVPWVNGDEKRLVLERGYGHLRSGRFGVELSDGWDPWRVELIQGATSNHDQIAFFSQLAQWLTKRVASQRCAALNQSAPHLLRLQQIASNEPGFETSVAKDVHRASFRTEFPESEPINARLSTP